MEALAQLAWSDAIFRPEKQLFFEYFNQFIQIMRPDHMFYFGK